MLVYLARDSLLHRLNPGTKILALVLSLVLPVAFSRPLPLLLILATVLVLAALGRCLSNVGKALPLLVMIGGFSTLLWSLLQSGTTPLLNWGPLRLYREAVWYGLSMGIRLDTMMIMGIIFISTTRSEEFTLGLRKLGVPYGMSFALSLAFRLVPLFFQRAMLIVQAQKARGLDLEQGGVINRMKKYVPLLVPIIIYALRDTDMLAMALESRGFRSRPERTYYLEFRVGALDFLVVLLLLGLNICIWFFYR